MTCPRLIGFSVVNSPLLICTVVNCPLMICPMVNCPTVICTVVNCPVINLYGGELSGDKSVRW